MVVAAVSALVLTAPLETSMHALLVLSPQTVPSFVDWRRDAA
jgi:hypothetical protein